MSRINLTEMYNAPKPHAGDPEVEAIMHGVERLLALGQVSHEEKEALTSHQHGYFSHKHAAKSQLSQGNMAGFRRELKIAKLELEDLEEILQKHWEALR